MTGRARPFLLVVVALLVMGCSLSDRSFGLLLPANGTIEALPVTLTDRAGIVISAESADETGISDPGVSNPTNQPDVLVVTWVGGECDHRVDLLLEGGTGAFVLSGRTDRDAACTLVGVIRTIRIELSTELDSTRVRFDHTAL